MAYTEIKERNGKRYYYRVVSIRKGPKVTKRRIYLGVDLDKKGLIEKEVRADREFLRNRVSEGLSEIRGRIRDIMLGRGIKRAGIFGSYARGEQKKNSDIDIVIEPAKDMGYFDIVSLEEELKKKLGKKIDLITYAGINKFLRNKILGQEVRVL